MLINLFFFCCFYIVIRFLFEHLFFFEYIRLRVYFLIYLYIHYLIFFSMGLVFLFFVFCSFWGGLYLLFFVFLLVFFCFAFYFVFNSVVVVVGCC